MIEQTGYPFQKLKDKALDQKVYKGAEYRKEYYTMSTKGLSVNRYC